MEDWTEKSFDLVKEEVNQGIDRHIAPADRRDDTQYLKLLRLLGQDTFSADAANSKLLRKYILAIDSKVSLLGECGKLVLAVLDLSWLGRDDTLIAIFTTLLCDLASAHAKFMPAMMERLVPHFARLPASLGCLPEETVVSRSTMFSRLHMVIKTILRQVPSASGALMKALKHDFPNDITTSKCYLQYQRHLLRLADSVPEFKSEILALLVQRLVSIDVQIQQDIEDLEEETEDKLFNRRESKAVNGFAADLDESDMDSISESEETMTEEEERLRDLKLKVEKMDGTLNLLFEYYAPRIDNGSSPQSNEAYQQLLSHFKTFILPNRTRYAQFLLFHFSQISSAHVTIFTEYCLQLSVNEMGGSTHRLTACAYVASFIARGARISKSSVRDIVGVLCGYIEDMRQRYAPTCHGPDRRNYTLYYAVAQTLLYIFCFRWRDLVVGAAAQDYDDEELNEDDALAEGKELAFLPGLKEVFHDNIYSRLNPLKICSQAIVGEFAKIAGHLRFLFVFPLLETNKRLRLGQATSYYGSNGIVDVGRRQTALDRKTGEMHHHLAAYFPFDPYTLAKSKHWVANDYNAWKLPPGLQSAGEDEDSASEAEYESDDESLPEDTQILPALDAILTH